MYYGDKRDVLSDIWGVPVTVEPDRLTVAGTSYPIIDDVIILLDPRSIRPH
jgi:hypothetical protein